MSVLKRKISVKNVSVTFITFMILVLTMTFIPMSVDAASAVNRPQQLRVALGDTTVKLKWKASRGADYYKIYQAAGNSRRYLFVKKVKGTAYTLKNLSCGRDYHFKVKAYDVKKGKTVASAYSAVVSASPRPVVGVPGRLLGKVNGNQIELKWNRVANATGYEVYYNSGNSSAKYKLYKRTIKNQLTVPAVAGTNYRFRVRARIKVDGEVFKGSYSKQVTVKVKDSYSVTTVKKLMQAAMEPVGRTMYVWGGGWNEADDGAGIEAVTMGVSPSWEKFFKRQSASYDYNNTRYQIHNGLDCSGYVGWCIYNALNTTNGREGYVLSASDMAYNYASRGWGNYLSRSSVRNYKAGDIMSSSCSDCGHVWIVIGECGDGSVVLVHSSPAGVQINGTVDRYGNQSSEAVDLAVYYMKKYFPQWYKKFPNCMRGSSYLSHYSQMRWDVTGKSVMKDPEGYQKMNAVQVL